jgi:hypothetical protein
MRRARTRAAWTRRCVALGLCPGRPVAGVESSAVPLSKGGLPSPVAGVAAEYLEGNPAVSPVDHADVTPTPGAKRSRQVIGLEPRTDRCYWRGSGTTRRRDGTSDRLDKELAQVLIGVDTEHLLAYLDVVEPQPLEDSPVQLGDALDAAELAPGGVTRSPRVSPSPRRPGRRHDPQRRRLKSLALRQAPICRPVRLRCAGR